MNADATRLLPVDALSPVAWPWAQSSPAQASSEATGWRGALVRSWSGTSAQMEQPPLDHHYVVLHQGGAKHVTRRRDGPEISTVVEKHALTLVPAHSSYAWRTEGPIAFTHLYVKPVQLEAFALLEQDIDASSAQLVERVGCQDRDLELLILGMLQEIAIGASASNLRLDTMLELFCARLVHRHLSAGPRRQVAAAALAPYRLRRVVDYVDAHLADDIRLSELATAAGASESHFGRAFRAATARSPYRYVLERRIAHAKTLLVAGCDGLHDIALACGFRRQQQFTTIFKQQAGIGPKRYRTLHRPRCAVVSDPP